VSDIIAEIAAASQEQSSGIEQVNKAVMQLDEVTQQNAALVEEAAASSEALDEQARTMADRMGFFSVDEQAIHDEPAPAPTRRERPAPARNKRATTAAPARRRSKPAPSSASDDDWEEF
jgi:methyl-accepting chemotaxis protein